MRWRSRNVVLSGSDVTQLTDISGNANHGTPESAPQRPTYNASDSGYGGKPSLAWTAANGTAVDSPALPAFGPFTIYHVLNVTTTGTYIHELLTSAADWLYAGIGFTLFESARGGSINITNAVAGAAWAQTGTPVIISRQFDGTAAGSKIFINGTIVPQTSIVPGDPGTTAQAWVLTLLSDAGGAGASDATWAETIVYDNVVSAPDDAAILAFLTSEYAL